MKLLQKIQCLLKMEAECLTKHPQISAKQTALHCAEQEAQPASKLHLADPSVEQWADFVLILTAL